MLFELIVFRNALTGANLKDDSRKVPKRLRQTVKREEHHQTEEDDRKTFDSSCHTVKGSEIGIIFLILEKMGTSRA